jgi:hypothetical protein
MTQIIEREMNATEEEERAAWAAEAFDRELAQVKETRRILYTRESDPLFFKYQRGENTEQAWLDAIAAIDAANPHPVQESTP